MNQNVLFRLLLTAAIVSASVTSLIAQGRPAPSSNPNVPQEPAGAEQRRNRPDLFRELGLSREQLQEVRKMNQERRPLMEAAVRRLRDANRALDQVVYADSLDESAFQAKLKEFQSAQAEMARIRFTSELQLRRILTAEQLVRFRELRSTFTSPPDGAPGNRPPFRGRRVSPGHGQPGGDRPQPREP